MRPAADTIARALDGRRSGDNWVAQCPAHDDRSPSLSIGVSDDGMVLVHCFAGCDQMSVISALRARGLWPADGHRKAQRQYSSSIGRRQQREDHHERTDAALAIWRTATPATSTLVETYLAARGIKLPVPNSLRFHGRLKHPSGGTWPAMVALVKDGIDGTPIAIHRTYISDRGEGKAPVMPAKMMLGPCSGGAVHLAEIGETLIVGEGIETCLAAMMATGRPAWAALSAPGLRALNLPFGVRDVIVLADGDEAGETAARNCALRWKREDRRVRIARPPWGMDFNDMLVADSSMARDRSR
jgi:putative DNA primase/helicase